MGHKLTKGKTIQREDLERVHHLKYKGQAWYIQESCQHIPRRELGQYGCTGRDTVQCCSTGKCWETDEKDIHNGGQTSSAEWGGDLGDSESKESPATSE